MNKFKVIDLKTGQEPDMDQIRATEEWASRLLNTNYDGFALLEWGHLAFLDGCGGYTYCPEDRFEIVWE